MRKKAVVSTGSTTSRQSAVESGFVSAQPPEEGSFMADYWTRQEMFKRTLLILVIFQFLINVTVLCTRKHCNNAGNGANDANQKNETVVDTVSYIPNTLHSKFDGECCIAIRHTLPVDNCKTILFEPVHTIVNHSFAGFAVAMGHNRVDVCFMPIKFEEQLLTRPYIGFKNIFHNTSFLF